MELSRWTPSTITESPGKKCARCGGYVPVGFMHLPITDSTAGTALTGMPPCYLVSA